MKTYMLYNANGSPFAFEIDNIYISLRKIEHILNTNTNVSEVKVRKLLSKDDSEIHIKFKYFDEDYIIWEPFGDNSRYWIGPYKDNLEQEMSSLEESFGKYNLNIVFQVFINLVSFKWLLSIGNR